jgi:hypothetical protein
MRSIHWAAELASLTMRYADRLGIRDARRGFLCDGLCQGRRGRESSDGNGHPRRRRGRDRPRLLVAFDELPRNGIGKIRRAAIRDDILSCFSVSEGSRPELIERR